MEIPDPVRRKALAAGAGSWLAGLPELVTTLEREWSITTGPSFADGTEAYVAAATVAGGTPAVLKLPIPRATDDAMHEITALRLAAGSGCARLLRHDASRGALLLERLGPSLHALRLPLAHRQRILCDLAARVWRRAAGCGLPTGADKGRRLATSIPAGWEELGRPCSARAVEHALECLRRRIDAHDDERAVLVHGDIHQWNALRAGDGFALVDPDGLLAEPECDLGVLMREDPVPLLRGDPWRRAHRLAARTGADPTAVWEWGVAERVSTGLICTAIGLQPVGRQMLAAADRIAAAHAVPG